MTTTTTRMYHWGRGLELRLHREELGLDIEEFATYFRVTHRTMQRWESDTDPIPATLWAEVHALGERLHNRMGDRTRAILDAAEAEGYPEFMVVSARTIRERRAIAAAQIVLDQHDPPTRLVTAEGMAAITSYGYEDPLVSDTP